MKKFLFWATVVGASLTGCVNDVETVLSPEDNPQPITFEVGKYKPSSRAINPFPVSETFGTFCYHQQNPTSAHTIYIDNEEVKHFSSYWTTEAVHYWPTSGGHLDFISYSPYEAYVNAVDDEGNPLETSLSAAVPKFNSDLTTLSYIGYEVIESNSKDLLYSDKAINQKSNTMFDQSVSGVPTLFHHALAKLSFRVRVQRFNNKEISPDQITHWSVKLNSITISNIYNKGNVSLKLEVSNTEPHPTSPTTLPWRVGAAGSPQVWTSTGQTISRTWTTITGGQDLTMESDGEVVGLGTSDLAQNYLVLPQTLISDENNAQKITLNYSITTSAPGGQSGTTTYNRTKTFAEFTTVQAWEMGKHIIYLIDIDPAGDIIHFAPFVEDWVVVDDENDANKDGISGKLDF